MMTMRTILAAFAGLAISTAALAQTATPTASLEPAPAQKPLATMPAPRDRVKVIHAGWLLAIPGQPPKQAQTVIVRNDRIEKIVPGYAAAPDEPNADVKTVELRNAFVLPGLMDMHVHLSNNNEGTTSLKLRGVSDELRGPTASQRNDVTELVDAIGNARKTLMAGYTTVRDLGSDGWHMAVLRDAIAAGKLEGPRIFASMAILRPGADKGDGACTGVESCRRETRRQIDKGADVIKIYATCSGSKPCGRQDAPPTFLPDELRAIIETARSRQLRVAAHAHGEAGIKAALEAGVDSIEHGSFTTPDAYPLFIRNHAFLVPTLSVQDNIRRDILTATGSMRAVMQNFLDKHGPRMMAAYRAGVKIAAGSDAGIGVHGNNARELELYVREGMPAADAIVAATVNGSALIGREADLGTLETGKIADIIAVEGNPLKDITILQQVMFVMKDGAIVRSDFPAPSDQLTPGKP